VARHAERSRLFTGGFDGTLMVTNILNNKVIKKISKLHESYLSNIYYSKNQKLIFTAGWKGNINILDPNSFEVLNVLKISDSVYFMTFLNNDKSFYAGGRNGNEIVHFEMN
jgi:WD40 repeat protein